MITDEQLDELAVSSISTARENEIEAMISEPAGYDNEVRYKGKEALDAAMTEIDRLRDALPSLIAEIRRLRTGIDFITKLSCTNTLGPCKPGVICSTCKAREIQAGIDRDL